MSVATIDTGFYWAEVEPRRGAFDFGWADQQVDWWRAAGMRIRGHPLIWSVNDGLTPLPPWLTQGAFSKRELTDIVVTHVESVAAPFEGRVDEWVVVNEPHLPGYGYPETDLLYNGLGAEYVEIAFEAARRVDPAATLILNHNDNQHSRGNVVGARALVDRLRARGLIDAVGVEMHLADMDWVPGGIPPADDVTSTSSATVSRASSPNSTTMCEITVGRMRRSWPAKLMCTLAKSGQRSMPASRRSRSGP